MSADGTGQSGADRRARQVGELLGASATGRGNGLSPQLVSDIAAVYGAAAPDGTGGPPVTVRVAVLRTDVDTRPGPGPGPGSGSGSGSGWGSGSGSGSASGRRLVRLLTGVRPPGPPSAGDLVPLTYVYEPADLPQLRLTEAQVRALDRLARTLLARPEHLGRAPLARHGTAAWLRVRAAQRRRTFFRTRYVGQEAVERAWRRIQDVTAAGAGPAPGPAGAVVDVPVRHPFLFHGDPLPWPDAVAGAGVNGLGRPRIEVTDLPVPPGGGPSAHLAEVLDSAHLVLAAAPHTALAGREPLPSLFRTLLDRGRPGGDRAETVLVATTAGRRGPGATAALGSWLRGRTPETVGPAARDLAVHAVAVAEAEHALRILRSPQGRPATAVEQARADWAMSGMPELCAAVLGPALDRVARTGGELTRRRFRAALHGVRLDCRGPAGARPAGAGEDDAEQLWDELEAFAAGPLAERAVRRFGPPAARTETTSTGTGTGTGTDAQDPYDSRGASSP
ncbi:hypothetical protein ACIPYQ_09580 [Streptomyces sp. NPDC090045]|uniref:hypothetical protein n=1 Tax=Streptomyces sp. NPDC090045 TaxID=3365927 RepID=UPI0037F5B0D5